MKSTSLLRVGFLCVLAALWGRPLRSCGQGTAFTYQGRLSQGANPATGLYDIRFAVYDSVSGGTIIAGPLTNSLTPVTNGLFVVTLDFGAGIFSGPNRWLDLAVRTNGSGAFAPLTPRQGVTASPYAITAGNLTGVVPNAGLGGTYGNSMTMNNAGNVFAGTFSGNGSGLSLLNADQLSSGIVPDARLAPNVARTNQVWMLGGNAGVDPQSGGFIGTVDPQAFEARVMGRRALRVEPGTNANPNYAFSPNVIGGFESNRVAPGVVGATIAGGGRWDGSQDLSHHVNAHHGTIGGGDRNTVNGEDATIAGGGGNFAAGAYSTVGGGLFNQISSNGVAAASYAGTVGGGYFNSVRGNYATIAGGYFNVASGNFLGGGDSATVGGGYQNAALGNKSVASGGYLNYVQGDYSVIAGGAYQTNWGGNSAIGGGAFNVVQSNCFYGTIPGGYFNRVSGGNSYETIGGGYQNTTVGFVDTIAGGYVNLLASDYGTIGGGALHTIGTNSNSGTISGGFNNTVRNNSFDCTIGGGSYGSIGTNSYYSTIGGGRNNTISDNTTSSTIAGGQLNLVQTGAVFASIGGGYLNTGGGRNSTVPGGYSNLAAGSNSLAAGYQAQALHDGAFVWSDGTVSNFASTGPSQFLVRSAGGVGINTNNPAGAALNVAGTVRAASFQGDGSGLINVNSGALGNYVFAYSTASQIVSAAGLFQDISFPTDAQIAGWSHIPGTAQYTNNQSGLYLIQYSAQAFMSSATGTNVSMRATLNFSEIPGSQSSVILSSTSVESIPLTRTFIANLTASDVLTLQVAGSSTSSRLIGFGTGSPRPSVSMTITRIQ